MSEQWRPVPGFPGYEVSDQGRVRTWHPWRGKPTPRVMAWRLSPTGYPRVNLTQEGQKVTRFVHQLVLLAFVGPPPEDKPQVLHWNDERTDNRLENLRYGTAAENSADSFRNGGRVRSAEPRRPRRPPWARDYCQRGLHPWTPENTYIHPSNGARRCKTCRDEVARAYRLRVKARRRSPESSAA